MYKAQRIGTKERTSNRHDTEGAFSLEGEEMMSCDPIG